MNSHHPHIPNKIPIHSVLVFGLLTGWIGLLWMVSCFDDTETIALPSTSTYSPKPVESVTSYTFQEGECDFIDSQRGIPIQCTRENGCILYIDLMDNAPNPCINELGLSYYEYGIEETDAGAFFDEHHFIHLREGPVIEDGAVIILANYPEIQGEAQFLWAFGNPVEEEGENKAAGYFDNRIGVLMGFAMFNDSTGCRGGGQGGHGGMGAFAQQGQFSLDPGDYYYARFEWDALFDKGATSIHSIYSDLSPDMNRNDLDVVQAELAERTIPYDPKSASLGCDGNVTLDGVDFSNMVFGVAPKDDAYRYPYKGYIQRIYVFNKKQHFSLF